MHHRFIKTTYFKLVLHAISIFSSVHQATALAETNLPAVKFYGFLLPTLTESSNGVESFSQGNASAYTAAGNPVLVNNSAQARLTFQIAQSRFGLLIGEKALQGRMEFDFIDFSKASPTTASLPRVRRATIDYSLSDTDSFLFGQDWDTFAPLIPHTYNFVGHYFEAGDLAFMRQQLVWIHNSSSFETRVALGLQAPNSVSLDSTIELSNTPTLALRATYKADQDQIGLSGIATQLLVDRIAGTMLPAYGLTLYGEKTFGEGGLNVRAEIYAGRNLANLGTLSLAFGNSSADVSEAGGWLSGKAKISEKSSVFAGAGFAQVLNTANMLASYTANASGTTHTLNAATNTTSTTGPGIEKNGTARVGYAYEPEKNLTLFTELAYLATTFHLLTVDQAINPVVTAFVIQSGMMLTF